MLCYVYWLIYLTAILLLLYVYIICTCIDHDHSKNGTTHASEADSLLAHNQTNTTYGVMATSTTSSAATATTTINGHDHSHTQHEHGHSSDHEESLVHEHEHDHSHTHNNHSSDSHEGHNSDHHKAHITTDSNMQAAALHVLTDLIQSIGVAIAGAVVWWRPSLQIVDPVCTVLFSILVMLSTLPLFRRIVVVLMEGRPQHVRYVYSLYIVHVYTVS